MVHYRDGLLPSLQLPWAGVLSSDVPPLFPVLVEAVLDEGFGLVSIDQFWLFRVGETLMLMQSLSNQSILAVSWEHRPAVAIEGKRMHFLEGESIFVVSVHTNGRQKHASFD